MNPLRGLPKATAAIASLLALFREKFRFLHGNLRLSLFWPIAALIVGAIGWTALFAKLNEDKHDTVRFAMVESSALARNYAEHLRRTLDLIDQVVLHVRLEWEVSGGLLQLEDVKSKGLFPESAPFNVAIIDRNGIRKTSTFAKAGARDAGSDLSDRPYFQTLASSTADFLYIGTPVVGKVTGDHLIQFARRLTDPNGDFDGVVMVGVKTDYFTANYDEVTLGRNGFLGVIGADGIVRATRTGNRVYPPESGALASPFFFEAPSGSMRLDGTRWFVDKRSRYVGWQLVEGYPFIAMVGLDEHDTLASPLDSRDFSIRVALAATFAGIVFTLIAMALSLRLAWRKHQMELTQATYRMATEGGNEGFYICRPQRDANGAILDFEAVDCNQRGAEFFRLRRDEFIGMRITSLHDSATADRAMKMLEEAMQAGRYEGEIELPAEHGRKRSLHVKAVRSDTDLAVTMRDITHEKAHVRELERRGNEDPLTGLPNRLWVQNYLPEALKRAAVDQVMLALLFIDLDGFKAVNDTMGHPAGDELLKNAARRLNDAVRPHDYVVRFGGDEFVVILERIAHEEDAAHVAQRVLHAFQESFRLSQGVASIGTSIGISVFPKDAANADALLQNADIAMYSVKTAGKRHYRFFDSGFYVALRARLEKEAELRRAIERDEFILHYQPRIDMASGRTSGMEALVRWQHPSKGLIQPVEFIPMAEETGLIIDLGNLVIEKVCAQLAQWAKSAQELVPVSVNVSPRQFNEVNMVKVFSSALARHRIDPALIEIELTETTMMGETKDVSMVLNTIHDMGIKLLVDDFGTGYSSLSQLQRLDFDVLKVDRAFTAEIEKSREGNVFFTAIITMAHALGMRVVAEGVENERQLNILKAIDCDEIQGFLVSHPVPAAQVHPIVSQRLLPEAI